MVDFINHWSQRAQIPKTKLLSYVSLHKGRYYNWCERYGKVNEHNRLIPRDHWLDQSEVEAIVDYFKEHPLEGYRRLTYMMLDDDIVPASPSTIYRVLSKEGLLERWNRKASKKGTGFVQPLKPHEHWHVDVSYINISGTFYYLFSVLDGCSRYILNWDIREAMKEADIEILIQQAREKYPNVNPRIISDNGPQFIAKDFKEFIRVTGMSHVRTSPYYPQSNGKLERYHRTLKSGCIRKQSIETLDQAKEIVNAFVADYNENRLHSAIGYVTPRDKLLGKDVEVLKAREDKLAAARAERKKKRAEDRSNNHVPGAKGELEVVI